MTSLELSRQLLVQLLTEAEPLSSPTDPLSVPPRVFLLAVDAAKLTNDLLEADANFA